MLRLPYALLALPALAMAMQNSFMPMMAPELNALEITGDCTVTGTQLFANELYGRELTTAEQITPSAAEEALMQQMRNLTRPSRPSFCNGTDTVLYIFPGCAVQTFVTEYNAFQQWEINQIKSMTQGGQGGQGSWTGGRGGNGGQGSWAVALNGTTPIVAANGTTVSSTSTPTSATITTTTATTTKPTQPTVPQFCTSF
ncbi:unnamed protein product, partial [Mesorhabditis spiculigera]